MRRPQTAAEVFDDGLVHLIAADSYAVARDDIAEADDGHFGGAGADIDDHAGDGFGDGEADADCGGLRDADQEHLAGAGAMGAGEQCAFFDGGQSAGGGHQQARAQAEAHGADFAEEVAEHRFAELEVGDHAGR